MMFSSETNTKIQNSNKVLLSGVTEKELERQNKKNSNFFNFNAILQRHLFGKRVRWLYYSQDHILCFFLLV